MHLIPLTDEKVSGTGTISDLKQTSSFTVLLSTDGTNVGSVRIRKNDASGDILLDLSSLQAGEFPLNPVLTQAQAIHYSISGTGASAQVFGYVG